MMNATLLDFARSQALNGFCLATQIGSGPYFSTRRRLAPVGPAH
jgi:hypothetical protein